MARLPNPGPRPTITQLRREFAEAHESELLSRALAAAGMGLSQRWLESTGWDQTRPMN